MHNEAAVHVSFFLFGLFSVTKEHHHFFGQTDVVSLVRDFVAFYPLCHGEFFMVNGEGVIAVYIAEKSKQQGTAEGPWLAFTFRPTSSMTSLCTVSSIVSPISAKPAISA